MPNIHDCKCEDKNTHYHLTVCCKGMKNEEVMDMSKPMYQILIHITEDDQKQVKKLRAQGNTIVSIFRAGIKILTKIDEEVK